MDHGCRNFDAPCPIVQIGRFRVVVMIRGSRQRTRFLFARIGSNLGRVHFGLLCLSAIVAMASSLP